MKEILSSMQEDTYRYYDEAYARTAQIDKIFLEKESEIAQNEISIEFEEDYEFEKEDIVPRFYLRVGEMDIFEIMKNYEDRFPLLRLRKQLWYLKSLVSYTCQKIIINWFFELICLIVILFNSVILALDDPTTDVNTPTQMTIDYVRNLFNF